MSQGLYLTLGFILLAAFLVILPSWRRGVYLLFGWLLVEDVVRRIIPGQPIEIQLVKEVILGWIYIAFFISLKRQRRSFWAPPFFPSLLAFSSAVLLDSLNPSLPGLFVPLLGIRSYLWYVPLLWVGY